MVSVWDHMCRGFSFSLLGTVRVLYCSGLALSWFVVLASMLSSHFRGDQQIRFKTNVTIKTAGQP